MKRVDQARKGYFNKDLEQIKKVHEKASIHKSIHHNEHHLKSFNLPEIILGGQDGIGNTSISKHINI